MSGPRPWRLIQALYPRMSAMQRRDGANLSDWSKEHLISYIKQLERAHNKATRSRAAAYPQPPHTHPHPNREQKTFNFAAYPRRKIALKFSYDGEHYSGLAAQDGPTPLPTVEEVLWGALTFTRLVDPAGGFEGCGWEKCGRTDAGVSSAGQVVSFWIRSALRGDEPPVPETSPEPKSTGDSKDVPEPEPEPEQLSGPEAEGVSALEGDFGALSTWDEPPTNTNIKPSSSNTPRSTSDDDELNYIGHLNNVLPPTIRAIAWSPVASDFSARFACQYRHYKYFFTSRGLNIDAMRDGASRLVGEHDFRNLCKVDAAKQITNFKRLILRAEISPVSSPLPTDDGEQVYVLDLVGTAFLYNQVRHIMAILFLVGTGLEYPSLVTALLNVDAEHPYPPFRAGEPTPPVVATKPIYQMADALPLVLWECAYAEGDVAWRTDGNGDASKNNSKTANVGSSLFHQQRAVYERGLIRSALDKHFLLAAGKHHAPPPAYLPVQAGAPVRNEGGVFGVPVGGGRERRAAVYVPVLERGRLEAVEVVNERWRTGTGARRAERARGVSGTDGADE